MVESDPEPTLLNPYFNKVHLDISIKSLKWASLDFNIYQYCHQVVSAVVFHVINDNSTKNFIEVSLLLSDDEALQDLNKEYRNKDKPTNVLSFPFLKNTKDEIINIIKSQPVTFLGDIAISYERVVEESLQQEKKLTDYFAHILIHGILHLFQYNHIVDEEMKIMEAMEAKIMQFFAQTPLSTFKSKP